MAVIQKIRNKYGKVAAGVIVLALVGFILMDATSSGRFSDLFGNDGSVAEVNGDKIDQKEYLQRQHDYEILYSAFSQGRPLDDATRAQLNEQVLRELIYEKLIAKECDKLGISVTKEEERELIFGSDPDPMVKQFPVFQNPDTKMFDPQRVKEVDKRANEIDNTGKLKEQWETLKAFAKRSYLTNKYNSLVSGAIVAPKYLVERDLKERSRMANLQFVSIPYATVSDQEIQVTDADLTAYMEKHKAEYMVYEPTRSIDYVSFEIQPTGEDSSRSYGALIKMKEEFVTTSDYESFVNRNSDDQYQDAFVNKRSFMSPYSDSILNLPVGSVYGPYFDNGIFKLTKVVDKKMYPDSVKCRHILVKTENQGQPTISDSAAQKKLDSAIAAVKSGAPFGEVVGKYSDDDGSKQTAGEYTFTVDQKTQLSKEFGDFIFDGKTGESKTVKVDNDAYAGYHYIEILEQKGMQPAAKLATVSKALAPGEATDQAVYAKATQFAGRNNTAKAFDDAAKNERGKRLANNIKPNDYTIQGIPGSGREMIRWIYEAKVGEVSQVFNLDGRYIVAKVSDAHDKGLPKLNDDLRQRLDRFVRAEKKSAIIMAKYKGMSTMDAVASASAQPIQQADSVSAANPYIQKLGYEPKVSGYVFYKGFNLNTMSPAIKGAEAVFFISVLNRWENPLPQGDVAGNQQRMMEMQLKNSAGSNLMEMLRRNADIEYKVKNL